MWNHVFCQRDTVYERVIRTWKCESSYWSWLLICLTVCCVCHWVGSDGCLIWVWRIKRYRLVRILNSKDNIHRHKTKFDMYLVFLLPGFFVMAGLMSFSVSGLSLIGCSLSLFSFSGVSPSGLTLSWRSPSGRPSTLARSPSPSGRSLSERSLLSLRSFLGGGGIGYCWATCWATSWELILGFLWSRSKAETWISLVVTLWAGTDYAPAQPHCGWQRGDWIERMEKEKDCCFQLLQK